MTANTMFAKRERYDMQNSTTFRSLLNLSRIAILLCVTLSGCGPTEKDIEDQSDIVIKALESGKDVALTMKEYNVLLTRQAHSNKTPEPVVYRITGVVAQRKADISEGTSDIRLILKPSWQDSRVEVNCLFDRSNEPKVSAMPLGTTVNVAGVFYSVSESDLSLIGCNLLE